MVGVLVSRTHAGERSPAGEVPNLSTLESLVVAITRSVGMQLATCAYHTPPST